MLILVGYLFTILKGYRMKKTVILTDAGISVESGLKTFAFLLVLIKIELIKKIIQNYLLKSWKSFKTN